MAKKRSKFRRAHEVEHPLLDSTSGDRSERSDKIDEILGELDVDESEARELYDTFIEVRTKKITLAKMHSKLKHIRFAKRRERVERTVDGRFDLSDRFEFNAVLTYEIFGEKFKKIHSLKTDKFSYSYLRDSDEESLTKELIELKKTMTLAHQKELDTFLSTLSDSHRYLSQEQILQILKSSVPDSRLTLPPISPQILLQVLQLENRVDRLHLGDSEAVCSVSLSYIPDGFSSALEYEAHTTIELDELLSRIYKEQDIVVDIDAKNSQQIFDAQLEDLRSECLSRSIDIGIKESDIDEWLESELSLYSYSDLFIDTRQYRRILFHFDRYLYDARVRSWRQKLLARTIRDFKNLFTQARSMRRELIFYVGETNSGKTYRALKELAEADTGYYLAPLRLLALEGYERLKDSGVDVSLITGEEQILDERATHVSSTIEMLDESIDVDVCVIDEVQMIDDKERGWAWANAIIGAPAKRVILTGSISALEVIEELAVYLNEPLKIIHLERKNQLNLLDSPTSLNQIKPQSAIITFSRRDVLNIKQRLSANFNVSVVYGGLSPEVRREEARRFRSGETDILVATDAIAMGLNLPIKCILFHKAVKYDGVKDRALTAAEVHQISGRAGRYGLHESGYIGALTPDVLRSIRKIYAKPIEEISVPFKVKANLDHILKVSQILQENSLQKILDFFVSNMQFNGPFSAINIDSMSDAAAIVDKYDLNLEQKYLLASAPLTLKSDYILRAYERYIDGIVKKKVVPYLPSYHMGEFAHNMKELLGAEDRVKEITLYLWLSYRFEEYFLDTKKARDYRHVLNTYIENSLKNSIFVAKCTECKKSLPLNFKFAICQSCFKRRRRSSSTRFQ